MLFFWSRRSPRRPGRSTPAARSASARARSGAPRTASPRGRSSRLHQTSDGFLWLGTTPALVRFDGQRFVVYEAGRRGLGHYSHARDLLELADGSLYAALVGGVARSVHGRFTFYDESAGLNHPFVYALAPGPDGSVWLGTGGTGIWRVSYSGPSKGPEPRDELGQQSWPELREGRSAATRPT